MKPFERKGVLCYNDSIFKMEDNEHELRRPDIHTKLQRYIRTRGSLTPENLASLMAAYFFVKFRKFLVRNSVIYDIIRLYHLS